MNEDYIRWLCDKIDFKYDDELNKDSHIYLSILIRCMWAINREEKGLYMYIDRFVVTVTSKNKLYIFPFESHNDSEQEALEKALEYIYEQEIKNKLSCGMSY